MCVCVYVYYRSESVTLLLYNSHIRLHLLSCLNCLLFSGKICYDQINAFTWKMLALCFYVYLVACYQHHNNYNVEW